MGENEEGICRVLKALKNRVQWTPFMHHDNDPLYCITGFYFIYFNSFPHKKLLVLFMTQVCDGSEFFMVTMLLV